MFSVCLRVAVHLPLSMSLIFLLSPPTALFLQSCPPLPSFFYHFHSHLLRSILNSLILPFLVPSLSTPLFFFLFSSTSFYISSSLFISLSLFLWSLNLPSPWFSVLFALISLLFPSPSFLTHLLGVSDKSGTALTKAMAAIVSSIPEAISIMPLEIAKVTNSSSTIFFWLLF